MSPLVKAHGWESVRPVWQRYIREKDPQFASPQDFKAKYGVWATGVEQGQGKAKARSDGLRAMVSGGLHGEAK